MRRQRYRHVGSLNLADLGREMETPNARRVWVSYGVVEGTDSEPCVTFDKDQGQVLVRVMLQPDLIPAYCRVAMRIAGNGEAEYHPFLTNDEVIVVVPEGSPRAGPVIIGKLNGQLDPFPMDSVAGQDPTKNNFAFKRTRTPYVEEYDGPLMFRSASTGGFLSIDEAGVVTIRAGDATDPAAPAAGFRMGPDLIGVQNAEADVMLQLNLTDELFFLRVKDLNVTLSNTATHPSLIGVPDALAIGTAGNAPGEHAMSTEAMLLVLMNFMQTLGAAIGTASPGPLSGATLAALMTRASTVAPMAAALAASGAGVLAALDSGTLSALLAAFASMPQKQASPTGQVAPGVGSPGLFIG